LLTFLITHNLRSTISVIIVAGACGIAAGTPLAILGAIGRAARKGSIIKGGIYLEALGQLHTVFFDKTGTLTYGLPSVTEIYPAAGVSKEQLIEAAASAERNSEHPLGGAIVRYAEQRKLRVSEQESFEYRVGRGVLAMVDGESVVVGKRGLLEDLETPLPEKHYKVGGTEVFVARGGSYLGSILIADEIRPSARSAVKALEKMNIRVVLLTGDSAEVAELFEMAHARTHADIKAALAPMDLYPANLILAGRDGTLLYIRPGRLPKRPDGVDVTLPLDGATSRTAWTGFVSLSEAVQVENPPQDYVSNDNVSPDRMYATPILDPQKYSAYYAFDPGQTNTRQLRMIELLENAHGVSDEAAIQITMDEKVLAPTSGEACSKRSSFPGPGLRTRILTSRRSLPPWRVSTVCSRKSRVGPSTTWLFARRYARRPTRLPGRSKALPKPGGRSRRRNSGVWRTPSWRRTPLFVRGLALSISSLETFTVSDELPTPFPSAVPRSIHRRTKESSTRSAPGSWSPAGLKRCGPWRFDRTSKTRALLDAYCCQRVPFVVTFHPDGSLTSYSEMLPGVSEDPSSPHFGDQMRLASQVELRPDYFYLLDLERNTESRIDIVVTGASSPMAKTK
jgi:hypothetical protein